VTPGTLTHLVTQLIPLVEEICKHMAVQHNGDETDRQARVTSYKQPISVLYAGTCQACTARSLYAIRMSRTRMYKYGPSRQCAATIFHKMRQPPSGSPLLRTFQLGPSYFPFALLV
jgi:hypothetical protein